MSNNHYANQLLDFAKQLGVSPAQLLKLNKKVDQRERELFKDCSLQVSDEMSDKEFAEFDPSHFDAPDVEVTEDAQ